MGKVAAAAAITGVGGTGAAALTTAHYLGAFGGSVEKNVLPKIPTRYKDNFKDFKEDDGEKCLVFTFREITEDGKNTINADIFSDETIPEITSQEDVKLGEPENSKAPGCFYWKLDTFKSEKDNKWIGSNFRFVWSLSRGDKGFVVYMSASGNTSQNLEFNGIVYSLEKQEKKWKAVKKLDIQNKTLSAKDLKNKFPQKGSNFPSGLGINKYWNFLDENGEQLQEVKSNAQKTYNFIPPPENHSPIEAVAWISNLDEWWNYFFGTTVNISEVVKNVKGKWI